MKKIFTLSALFCAAVLSAINLADYGAGPMLKPGRTFYVSTKGDNKNDGSSLAKAFRTIGHGVWKLRAGDTLLIEGGTYFEPEIPINVKDGSVGYNKQCGKPGSPIRIMGMKGHTVRLHGGTELYKTISKKGQISLFEYKLPMRLKSLQEIPSGIELQPVPSEKEVMELPGTFYYNPDKKTILVHYAALEQKGVSVYRLRVGIRIHGSYIHLENLNFSYYREPVYVRMNRPFDKNKASHVTIQNCNFTHNAMAGIVLDGASWSLVRNNRGYGNTIRGNFLNLGNASDNLIWGNWSGPTPQTLRHKRLHEYNYGINSYIGSPPRNHVVGNLIEGALSFRWKKAGEGNIFQDNIVKGSFHVESPAYKVFMRNNYFGGRVSWPGICGYNGWEKDFENTPVTFTNNTRDLAKFRPLTPAIEEAKKLKIPLPVIKFPAVTFKNLRAAHISNDGAAIMWETPDCDGWGSLAVREEGKKGKTVYINSALQGSRHIVGITGLKPDTLYTYQAGFTNRRGGKKVWSASMKFRTSKTMRAPGVLEVGKGKYTLEEAAAAAIPGDTVKLLPGVHSGRFVPIRSGLPGKPITLYGKGAKLDAKGFYTPAVLLSEKEYITIDGVHFDNADITSGQGVIRVRKCRNITIRNCRSKQDWQAGNFVTMSHSPGSVIENNVINDGSYPIEIAGGGVRILNNTIVNATMISLLLWDPFDIEVRNNIFYRPCIDIKRSQAILLNNPGKNIISEGNVFWSPYKHHPVGGKIRDKKIKVLVSSQTLEEWQRLSGFDKTSVHVDPLFVDYKNEDFRLRPDSPVKGKGASL